jgi:hypothetical protein
MASSPKLQQQLRPCSTYAEQINVLLLLVLLLLLTTWLLYIQRVRCCGLVLAKPPLLQAAAAGVSPRVVSVSVWPILTLISWPAWLGQPSASMRKGRRIITWRRQQQQRLLDG